MSELLPIGGRLVGEFKAWEEEMCLGGVCHEQSQSLENSLEKVWPDQTEARLQVNTDGPQGLSEGSTCI